MTQSRDLLHLLQRYLAGTDDLTLIREYVTAHLGDDDELVDYVSMEIWYLEDGYVTEDRLRERLGEYLLQSGLLPAVSTTGKVEFNRPRPIALSLSSTLTVERTWSSRAWNLPTIGATAGGRVSFRAATTDQVPDDSERIIAEHHLTLSVGTRL